jgi:tetratricopeptide (TPR) repeat protein
MGDSTAELAAIRSVQEMAAECWRNEQYPRAEQLFRQAIRAAESVLDSEHILLPELLCQLGQLRNVQEQFDEALALGESALRLLEASHGQADRVLVTPLELLADTHFQIHSEEREYHKEQSETSFLRAISILEACGDQQWLAKLLADLGWFYYYLGRYEEAERLYTRAYAIVSESTEANLDQVANCAWKLALIYRVREEFGKDASRFHAQAQEALEKLHGPEHPEVAENLLRHGIYFYSRKRDEEAAPLYEQAITMLNAHPEWNSSTIRWMWQEYAQFRKQIGQEASEESNLSDQETLLANIEARANAGKSEIVLSCRENLQRKEKLLGPDHPEVADCLYRCALHLRFEDCTSKEAEQLLLRALAIGEKAHGPADPSLVEPLQLLARIWQTERRFEEAGDALTRALRIRQATDGPGSVGFANVLERQALLEQACGSAAQAELLYRRAMAIYEKEFEPDSYALAESLWQFGKFYEERREFDKALGITQRLPPLAEKWVRGDCSAFDYFALHARVLYALGKMQEWLSIADRYKALSLELGFGHKFDAYLIPQVPELTTPDESNGVVNPDLTIENFAV